WSTRWSSPCCSRSSPRGARQGNAREREEVLPAAHQRRRARRRAALGRRRTAQPQCTDRICPARIPAQGRPAAEAGQIEHTGHTRPRKRGNSMSRRWQYKVVELPYKVFGGKLNDRAQAELDKLGAQGWELVSVVQSHYADALRMFLKKEN